MNPTDQGSGLPPDKPASLQERARQLQALNEQLRELNAHLEYLRLMLKLGVRRIVKSARRGRAPTPDQR